MKSSASTALGATRMFYGTVALFELVCPLSAPTSFQITDGYLGKLGVLVAQLGRLVCWGRHHLSIRSIFIDLMRPSKIFIFSIFLHDTYIILEM